MQTFCTEFHINMLRNVESAGVNLFTSLSKVRLTLTRFYEISLLLECLNVNFMKIRRTVYSVLLGLKRTDGWKRFPHTHTVLFFFAKITQNCYMLKCRLVFVQSVCYFCPILTKIGMPQQRLVKIPT